MTDRRALPYGSWPSPITIEMAVTSQLTIREPRWFGNDVYWTEGRPAEQGRQVIVRWNERDGVRDVTPPPFNARTMIHEYGGGWYTVDVATGTVYFSNLPDDRIYSVVANDRGCAVPPKPLTAEGPFATATRCGSPRAAGSCASAKTSRLSAGHDRQRARRRPGHGAVRSSSPLTWPRCSPGSRYRAPTSIRRRGLVRTAGAWRGWRGATRTCRGTTNELWVAGIRRRRRTGRRADAAGGSDESIVQPEWAPDGSIVFVSDRIGLVEPVSPGPQPGSARRLPWRPWRPSSPGRNGSSACRWYGIDADGTILRPAAVERWQMAVESGRLIVGDRYSRRSQMSASSRSGPQWQVCCTSAAVGPSRAGSCLRPHEPRAP